MRSITVAGLLLAFAAPLPAQATRDQAKLMFTIAAGMGFGSSLWSVGRQPIEGLQATADTFALARRIRRGLNIYMSGTYFRGANLGFSGEAALVGLGYSDNCDRVFDSGSERAGIICNTLDESDKPSSAVLVSAGPVFRVGSQSAVSPFVRANIGLLLSSQSSVRTQALVPDPLSGDAVVFLVYDDPNPRRLRVAFTVGGGFTMQLAPGYQVRLEARDNILPIQRVIGAAARDGDVPPREVTYRHVPSIAIGFDVILERRRGRRY
jgi:hypothetical protein